MGRGLPRPGRPKGCPYKRRPLGAGSRNFKRLLAHARLEETDHRDRVRYLNNQLVVALVLQRDHDDPLRIVDIPEYTLPMLIECPGGDYSGHMRAGRLDSVPPAARGFGVQPDVADMSKGNLEVTLEGSELVNTFDLKDRDPIPHRYLDHAGPSVIDGPRSPVSRLTMIRSIHTNMRSLVFIIL